MIFITNDHKGREIIAEVKVKEVKWLMSYVKITLKLKNNKKFLGIRIPFSSVIFTTSFSMDSIIDTHYANFEDVDPHYLSSLVDIALNRYKKEDVHKEQVSDITQKINKKTVNDNRN